MRNTLIIGTLSVALLQPAFAQQNEVPTDIALRLVPPTTPGDIAVRLSDDDPPPKSKEEQERDKKRYHVMTALPYGYSPRAGYTLGQMVKECDRIVIGRVSRIEAQRGVGWFGLQRDPSRQGLMIGIETNLFGSGNCSILRELDEWGIRYWEPKQEKSVLIFLADKEWRGQENTYHFDYKKKKAKSASHGKEFILFGDLGAIEFDDAETEKAYLAAMDGYLKNLRGCDRGREAYYEFLLEISKSLIERIRDDAITDLMRLLHYAPSSELELRLDDKRLDDRLKDYVRVIVFPNRKKIDLPYGDLPHGNSFQIPEHEKAEREKAEQQKTGQPKPQ